jgi:hypothetical protein
MPVKIYPSITTTDNKWKESIKEVKDLKLSEICFFPTCLGIKERKEAYKLLEQTSLEFIPLVHLRHDFKSEEIKYFNKRFKTQMFNIHSQANGFYLLENDLSEYRDRIYIENTTAALGNEPKDYAGICLDLTHLENARLTRKSLYKSLLKDLKNNKVGPCHLSAVPVKHRWLRKLFKSCDRHYFDTLEDLNFALHYKKYIRDTVALELENPIHQQLKAVERMTKLLGSINTPSVSQTITPSYK